jgi:AraC-like DNA-binding protein
MDDRAEIRTVEGLGGLRMFSADIVRYSFKRHAHDYYVVGYIEDGVQSFSCGGGRYRNPPRGVVAINPGDAHTGEAALPGGFRYRAFYPSADEMARAASEIGDRAALPPDFPSPAIEDARVFGSLSALFECLRAGAPVLEEESRYLGALALLAARHASPRPRLRRLGREGRGVARVKDYIEGNYGEDIRLSDLARIAGLSPFYLIRAFRAETGLPPHAYLASVRVREAQRLLRSGMGLADVAYETGFSSQSHFTTIFKDLIGVTPGRYSKAIS